MVGITLVDILQNWLNWFHFFFLEGDLLIILIDCMIFLSIFRDGTKMSMSTVCLFTHLDSGILYLYNVFLWPMILVVWSLELTDIFNCRFFLNRLPVCFNLIVLFFSCNSMLCSGCSALQVVNPNLKKISIAKNHANWFVFVVHVSASPICDLEF